MSYQQNIQNYQNYAKSIQPSPINLNISESYILYLPDLVKSKVNLLSKLLFQFNFL